MNPCHSEKPNPDQYGIKMMINALGTSTGTDIICHEKHNIIQVPTYYPSTMQYSKG
jgi:hypothetical protein